MKFFKSFFKKSKKETSEKKEEHIPYTNIPKNYSEDLAILFAERFTQNKGKFFFCQNTKDLKMNFELVLKNENIKLLHCFDDSLYDLITNFDVGFTVDPNDQSDSTLLKADYIEAKTGKIYLSKTKIDLCNLALLSKSVLVIAHENQLIEQFINLYNDFYSLQNVNQFTTFSIFKSEIILFLIERNK